MDKGKRRTSILKPNKVDTDLLNANPEEQIEKDRKVRFSTNFVKPFATDNEKSTIWGTSYEETIGTEESTNDRLTMTNFSVNETKNATSSKSILINKTALYNNDEMELTNFSINETANATSDKSILYNNDEMELTRQPPSTSTSFNKTMLFEDHIEMEFTQAFSKNTIMTNRNRIPFQDATCSAINDMEFTECLNKSIFVYREKSILTESVQDKENRTVLFHDEMDITNVVNKPSGFDISRNENINLSQSTGGNNKEIELLCGLNEIFGDESSNMCNSILFNSKDGEDEMHVSKNIDCNKENVKIKSRANQKTILFDDSMDFTEQLVPQKVPNRKSICNKTCFGDDMEFTQCIPATIQSSEVVTKTSNKETMIFGIEDPTIQSHFSNSTQSAENQETAEVASPTKNGNTPKRLKYDKIFNTHTGKFDQTILFNTTTNDDEMEMTEVIKEAEETSKTKLENRRTILFGSDGGDMDLIEQLPNNISKHSKNILSETSSNSNKTKITEHFLKSSKNTIISLNPSDCESNNRKTILFGNDVMDITEKLQNEVLQENCGKTNRKTILFDAISDGEMEITESISNTFLNEYEKLPINVEKKNRKTILFNTTLNSGDMDLTETIPKVSEISLNTISIYTDNDDMEIMAKLPNKFGEVVKRNSGIANKKTILFDGFSDVGEMELTESVPNKSNKNEKLLINSEKKNRKTILFNATSNGGDMDITETIPKISGIHISGKNQHQSEPTSKVNRKTILFGTDNDDLEITEKFPNDFDEVLKMNSRKTILFNASCDNAEMEITESVPNTLPSQNLLKANEKLPTNHENKNRKTTLFNATFNNTDMDIKETIPKISGINIPDKNHFQFEQSLKANRQTILFGTDNDGMEITEKLPNVFDRVLKENSGNANRKTIVFNATSDDAEMELTESIPNTLPNKNELKASDKLPINIDITESIANVSQMNISDGIQYQSEQILSKSNRKMNLVGTDNDMEITEKLPNDFDKDLKKNSGKTLLFNATSDNTEMEITENIPNALQIKNLLKNSDVFPSNSEKKNRKTISNNTDVDVTENNSNVSGINISERNQSDQVLSKPNRTNLVGTDNGKNFTDELSNDFDVFFNENSGKTDNAKMKITESVNNDVIPSNSGYKNRETILFYEINDKMEGGIPKPVLNQDISIANLVKDVSNLPLISDKRKTSNKRIMMLNADTDSTGITETSLNNLSETSIAGNEAVEVRRVETKLGCGKDINILECKQLISNKKIIIFDKDLNSSENNSSNNTNCNNKEMEVAENAANIDFVEQNLIEELNLTESLQSKKIHKISAESSLKDVSVCNKKGKEISSIINIDISEIMQNQSSFDCGELSEIAKDDTLKTDDTFKRVQKNRQSFINKTLMSQSISADILVSHFDMKFKRRLSRSTNPAIFETDDSMPIPDLITSNIELVSSTLIHSDLNASTRQNDYITPDTSFNQTNFTPHYDDTQHLINYQLSSKKKTKSDLSKLICGDEVPSPLNPNLMPLGQSVTSSFNIDTNTPSAISKRPLMELTRDEKLISIGDIETENISIPDDTSIVHIINNTIAPNLSMESIPSFDPCPDTSVVETEVAKKMVLKKFPVDYVLKFLPRDSIKDISLHLEIDDKYESAIEQTIKLIKDISNEVKIITSRPIYSINLITQDNFETDTDDFVKYLENGSNSTSHQVSLHDKVLKQAEISRSLIVELIQENTYLIRTLWNFVIINVSLGDKIHGYVTNYKYRSVIKKDRHPEKLLIHDCFLKKIDEQQIQLAIGNKYTILTLLDYIELNCEYFNLAYNKFVRLSCLNFIQLTKDYKLIIRKTNIELGLIFEVHIDFTNPNNINEKSVTIIPIKGIVVEYEIMRLIKTCPMGFEFIESINFALDHFLRDKMQRK